MNRHRTRPQNASAHPGKVLLESTSVRRKPEEIKNNRNKRIQAKKKKADDKQAAIKAIALLENEMALDDEAHAARIPHQETGGEL